MLEDSIGLLHFQQLTCPIVRVVKNKQINHHNNNNIQQKQQKHSDKPTKNVKKSMKSIFSQSNSTYSKSSNNLLMNRHVTTTFVFIILFMSSVSSSSSSTSSSPDYQVVEKHLLKVLGIKKRGASKQNSQADYLHRIYTGQHSLEESLLKSVNTARQFGKYKKR